MKPTDPALPQTWTLCPIEQQIAITSAARTETSVKFVSNRLCPTYGDSGWQMRINPSHPSAQRPLNFCFKMHNLLRCMDAGIGSACTDDAYRLPGNLPSAQHEPGY